jgi:DNA-binding response OmpR family regulator
MAEPKQDFIRRVLVVDDDYELAELLAEVLTYENCVCDVAANGQDAIQQLLVFDYEAVICDLMMPMMDGVALYKKVVQDHPYLADRFVFITGELLRNSAKTEVIYRSNCPVIEKPFKVEELRSVLQKMFDR